MKRTLLFLTVLLIGGSIGAVNTLQLNSTTYTVDTLAHFMAGPGSFYTSLELKAHNTLHVYFLKVDARNPAVRFESALGRDSILLGEGPSSVAKRKSRDGSIYFGGTNGDFYITQGYVGLPTGGTLVENQLAYTPNNQRKVFGFDNFNTLRFGVMQFSGTVTSGTTQIAINKVNHLRANNQVVLYNQHQGKRTKTDNSGCEVEIALVSGDKWRVDSVVHAVVLAKHNNAGNTLIVPGQAVLSGHGTGATQLLALEVGDTLTLDLNTTINSINSCYNAILGGDPRALMLNNGVVEGDDVWNENHPRTALGVTANGDSVIFCVVDGRGVSAGCTTYVLAQLMQSAGAYTAINLDGGGSSCIYLREFGPMNKLSDGSERAVSNSIFAVANAPIDSTIATIHSFQNRYKVPLYGIVDPVFLGYSQYDVLIDTDVKSVVLSCDSSYGYITTDGAFVASKGVNGFITATYNGNITTQVPFEVVSQADVKLPLDSILLDNDAEYPIEVECMLDNKKVDVLAQALTWTIMNPAICSVNDGKLKGLSNGRTMLIGTYGSISDTIYVHVELPTAAVMHWEQFDSSTIGRWEVKGSSSSWNTQMVAASNGQPASVNFTFSASRMANIQLNTNQTIYSTPDSLQFRFKTDNVVLSFVLMSFKSANSTVYSAIKYENIPTSGICTLTVHPEQYAVKANDYSVFPLQMNNITFYIDGSNTPSNAQCRIELYDIVSYFGGVQVVTGLDLVQQGLAIYPNPVHQGVLYINTGSINVQKAFITTIDGKVIKELPISNFENGLAQCEVSSLPNGTYMLMLSIAGKNHSVKLIINQ